MWKWLIILLLLAWAITLTVLYDHERHKSCSSSRQADSVSETISETTDKTEARTSSKTLHPLHRASLDEQFTYWKLHTPDWSAITEDDYKYVAVVDIHDGEVVWANNDNTSAHKSCLDWFMRYITPLVTSHPEWNGKLFVHTPDGPLRAETCKFPVISWNVLKDLWVTGQLLGVDPYFMNDFHNDAFPGDDLQPFSEKKNVMNFRGNTTNPKRTWTIEKYYDNPAMDFKFSSRSNENFRILEKHPDLFGDFMEVRDQRAYKYLVNIDGYGAAWNRTEWQLRSQCIMFLDTQYYMFTSKHLKPWVHYVPFSATPEDESDDLVTHLQFIEELEDDQASTIPKQANSYAHTLNTTSQALLYTEALIYQALEVYVQHNQ